MAFPATRLRRLRQTGLLRELVRETELAARAPGLADVRRARQRAAARRSERCRASTASRSTPRSRRPARLPRSGIPAVLLFGIPADKDEEGSGAWDDEGVVQLATRAIKAAHPDLLVITDLCLCEYTSHGHCGVLRDDGDVDNDATLELLARTAVSQAARRRRRRRAERHDGRPRRRPARRARRARPRRDADHGLLARSSPPPSTGRSARPPTRRPRSATAAATRWIPPTPTRRCARRGSTSRRAPTS